MRAMQSNRASGLEVREQGLATPGYGDDGYTADRDETPQRRRSDGESGVRAGEIGRKTADLLRALDLNATLLEICELSMGQSEQFEAELRELMDRSWRLTELLVECSEGQNGNRDDSVGEVFLPLLPCRGSGVKQRARLEYVDPVHGTTTWEGTVLEEAAAGWIAC